MELHVATMECNQQFRGTPESDQTVLTIFYGMREYPISNKMIPTLSNADSQYENDWY